MENDDREFQVHRRVGVVVDEPAAVAGTQELRILMLEDSELDAELIRGELEGAGIECQVLLVQEKEPFCSSLKTFRPDVILADYQLPSFDGETALVLAQEHCPEVPLIFVSGAVGMSVEEVERGTVLSMGWMPSSSTKCCRVPSWLKISALPSGVQLGSSKWMGAV